MDDASRDDPPITRLTPLAAHPELEVFSGRIGGQGAVNEYRVYDFRTLPSGRVVHGGQSRVTICGVTVIIAWLARYVQWAHLRIPLTRDAWCGFLEDRYLLLVGLIVFMVLLRSRLKLYQSISPLPGLGLQLETTTYFAPPFSRSLLPLSRAKTFVPLSDIATVVINEAPTRWYIHYYLAVILREGRGVVMAFDRVRPRHAVLREVYHAIREQLFDEYAKE